MMKNELKDICDKLEGYKTSGLPEWEVVNALRTDDGKWHLVIQKPVEKWEEAKVEPQDAPQEANNADE